ALTITMDDDGEDAWLWGYVNASGEMAIPARFDFAGNFENEHAVVKVEDSGYGVIDREGNYIIEPIYEYIIPDEKEFIVVQEERFGRINKKGDFILKPTFGALSSFQEGMAVAYPLEGELCGYIDRSGNYLIEPQFALGTPPREGVMVITAEDGSWKLMDKKGNDVNTSGYTIEYVSTDYLSYSIYLDDPYGRGSSVMSINNYNREGELVDMVEEVSDYGVSEEPVRQREEPVFEGNEIVIPGTRHILIVTGPSEPDFLCIGVGFHHPFGGGSNTYIEVKRRGGQYLHREGGTRFQTLEQALEDGLKDLFLHFHNEEIWERFVEYGGLKIFIEQAKKYIDDNFLDSGWNEIYG
ncbi:WG repeat-containing protein, partial [Bacteroidales bacterium OttesenSCG-928-J19]|nr:WG repeat-containing protein [Bacteroidales bacterium OttesenSCG-928-J19]